MLCGNDTARNAHRSTRKRRVYAGELQEDPSASFGTFLDSSLQPLLKACEQSMAALPSSPNAATLEKKYPNSAQIFLLNCTLSIWSPLSLHRSCAQHVAQLRTRIDSQVRLHALHADFIASPGQPCFLTDSHIQVDHLAKAEAERLLVACSVPAAADGDAVVMGMSTPKLRSLMQGMFVKFSAVDAIPDYDAITVPRFRVAVSQATCEGLVSAYKVLHSAYISQGGEEGEVKAPEQIATLLGA